MDFVAGVGFRFFACGFRRIGGGFRGFRLLAGPDLNTSAASCKFRGEPMKSADRRNLDVQNLANVLR